MATATLPFKGDSSGAMFKDSQPDRRPSARFNSGPACRAGARSSDKCLEKDRGLRYQHASDLCTDLKRLKRDTDSEGVAALGIIAKPPQQAMEATALSSTMEMGCAQRSLLLVGIGIYWQEKRHYESQADTVFTPVPLTWYPGSEYNPSFSPDGTQVVFQWCTESPVENCDIYIKQIGVEPPFQLTTDPAFDC